MKQSQDSNFQITGFDQLCLIKLIEMNLCAVFDSEVNSNDVMKAKQTLKKWAIKI